MRRADIENIVTARIEDAEILYDNKRYDGSVYLCGYAVELCLKARICKTMQWEEYPTSGQYKTFKTHDLDVLLHLTGLEEEVKLALFAEWSIVAQWSPESRYNPVGSIQESDAKDMIESTRELIKQI